MIANQGSRRKTLVVDPRQLRVQIVSSRGEEVCFRVVKAEPLGDVAVYFGQREHQSGKQCGVSDFIDDRWTNR